MKRGSSATRSQPTNATDPPAVSAKATGNPDDKSCAAAKSTLTPDRQKQSRLVYLDAFRSLSVTIVIVLHALEVSGSCQLECNWTQPTFYFEYMSGLFFMISGLVNGLSVCGQLHRGRSNFAVLRTQSLRACILVAVGLSMQAIEDLVRPTLVPKEPFNHGAINALLAPDLPERFMSQLRSAAADPRALTFHGLCTFLSACVLLAAMQLPSPARRTHLFATPAILAVAALVLAAHAPLQTAVDRATCCTTDYHCKNTDAASVTHGPPFRVPSRCVIVIGNGTAEAGSDFDPCDFDASAEDAPSSGLFLPTCRTSQMPAATAAQINVSVYELPPSSKAFCERRTREYASDGCVDAGPWRAGAHEVTCDHLVMTQECGKLLGETSAMQAFSRLGAPPAEARVPVAELCRLQCMPWACSNSVERRAQERSLLSDPSEFQRAEAEKPEAEREQMKEAQLKAAAERADAVRQRRERLRARDGANGANGGGSSPTSASATSDTVASDDDPDAASPEARAAQRERFCREELVAKYRGEARRRHGLPQGAYGHEWCPTIATNKYTGLPETVAKTCKRRPWWKERAMTAPELRHDAILPRLCLAFASPSLAALTLTLARQARPRCA